MQELQTIKSNNKSYKSQNHSLFRFRKNDIEKDKELLAYSISIASKYHLFRKKEIGKNLPLNKNYDRNKIKSSIKANIDSVEGNAVLETYRNNKQKNKNFRSYLPSDEYYQYFYSKEEYDARNETYNIEIANISHNMAGKNKLAQLKQKYRIKQINGIL